VLIATGALSPAEFIPIAAIAMFTGSFLGYSWARQVGRPGLERLATRLHAGGAYSRAATRLQRAELLPMVIARLIPAVRIQATLAAGAVAVDRRRFFIADAIGIAVWLAVLVTLGWLIGVPAAHFLGRAFSFLISGGVLLLLGFAAYQIARRRARTPLEPALRGAIQRVPVPVRLALAVALDVGLIAVIVAGLGRIARFVELIDAVKLSLPLVPDGVYDLLVIAGVAAIAYLVSSRLSLRATVGERLFAVQYRRMRRKERAPA
jgi:membrane protein DedA with SNARE-associated domain